MTKREEKVSLSLDRKVYIAVNGLTLIPKNKKPSCIVECYQYPDKSKAVVTKETIDTNSFTGEFGQPLYYSRSLWEMYKVEETFFNNPVKWDSYTYYVWKLCASKLGYNKGNIEVHATAKIKAQAYILMMKEFKGKK